MRTKTILRASVAAATLFYTQAVCALDITPFNMTNQSPLVQIYGLPSPGNATLLSPGRKEFHARLDHSSNYVNESNPQERLLLDGETTRMTLGGRYGLAPNVELGIDVPYIVQGGGFLDGFLINYHDLFGFAQGGRDQAPRDRLLYRYEKNGVEKLRLDHSGNGFGDVSLSAGYQLYHDGKAFPRAVAVRTALKLPTGESGSLRGSGSTDFSLWVTASDGYGLPVGHGAVFAALGFMAMTEGAVLSEQQRRGVGFGTVGAGWSPLSWIAFKVQLDAHTAFYKDSRFDALTSVAAQLQMGGTLALSERTTLDIAVVEDVAVQTAPDVTFHFDLRTRF